MRNQQTIRCDFMRNGGKRGMRIAMRFMRKWKKDRMPK